METFLAFTTVGLILAWAILLAGRNEEAFTVISTILGMVSLFFGVFVIGLAIDRVFNVLAAL